MAFVDRWLFETYRLPLTALAVSRIYLGAVLLLMLPNGLWVGHMPPDFFDPPLGPTYLFFGDFLPMWTMVALNAVAVVAAASFMVGYRTVTAGLTFTAAAMAIHAAEFSTGKIDHTILLVIAPAAVALAGGGWRFSVDAQREPDRARAAEADPLRAWPLALFALCVGFGLFTAGLPKLMSGWLDTSYSATYGHLLRMSFAETRSTPIAQWAIENLPDFFWEAGDWMTVGFEILFLPAVLTRRTFYTFLVSACLFHVGVMVLFSIVFWTNISAYALFVDWSRFRFRRHDLVAAPQRPRFIERYGVVIAAALAAAWILAIVAYHANPITLALGEYLVRRGIGTTIVIVGTLIAVVLAVRAMIPKAE